MDTAKKSLRWVQDRLPNGCEAEIYISRGRERGVEMRDGRLETLQESCDEGLGLRVLRAGRGGFAFAAGLNAENLGEVLRQALAQLPHLPADRHRAFPSPSDCHLKADPAALQLKDSSIMRKTLEEQLPKLREMEKVALQTNSLVRRAVHLGYGEDESDMVIVNTLGVRAAESGTRCSVGLSVMAEKGAQVQIGSGSASARFYEDLDFRRVAQEGAQRASVLIDSKKLPTRRRAILLDPWVAGEFLDVVAEALSAEEVQRGKSLFAGKLGRKVASPLVDLIDDPLRPRGISSGCFDEEGVPTRRNVLVKAGILQDYFYDIYTANKDRRASNGCAGRASYRGVPGPSCSNFFLGPGPLSRDQIIADTKDGVLVFEVMGMHMTDPVSGEFSVGISGIAVENGELTHGVRGAMLSGNVMEMLDQVDAVANDLTFYGRMAAPTFRVRDLMVA